ncbi:MAG TPA: YfiR family protein [Xanthomonadaceae bacterium]|nr:YfiR family protein [Xanthomonadaceae bacterium]
MNTRKRLVVRVVLGFAIAFVLLSSAVGAVLAQGVVEAPEPRVKAAFLFKFGSYVEWPPTAFASATAPFTIGVMDADALADELTTIVADRNVDGRSVVVRRLHEGDPVAGLNVLFIGNAGRGRLAELLAPLKGRATLAVTESEGALELGSMINFVVADSKVRFDVSLPSAAAASLKISSRLLAVARKVSGAAP